MLVHHLRLLAVRRTGNGIAVVKPRIPCRFLATSADAAPAARVVAVAAVPTMLARSRPCHWSRGLLIRIPRRRAVRVTICHGVSDLARRDYVAWLSIGIHRAPWTCWRFGRCRPHVYAWTMTIMEPRRDQVPNCMLCPHTTGRGVDGRGARYLAAYLGSTNLATTIRL